MKMDNFLPRLSIWVFPDVFSHLLTLFYILRSFLLHFLLFLLPADSLKHSALVSIRHECMMFYALTMARVHPLAHILSPQAFVTLLIIIAGLFALTNAHLPSLSHLLTVFHLSHILICDVFRHFDLDSFSRVQTFISSLPCIALFLLVKFVCISSPLSRFSMNGCHFKTERG